MDKSIILGQLLDMQETCQQHHYCNGCSCRSDCDAFTEKADLTPQEWKLPTRLDPTIPLEELTKAHQICNSCSEGCNYYHPYAGVTEECPFQCINHCQYDNDAHLLPSEWMLPKIDEPALAEPLDSIDVSKKLNLSELSTEDLLNELQRREVSPNLMERLAIEQRAAQFKKDHLDVFKAAITIHEYCESTEEYRCGRCDKCFLYDYDTDECGVGWSEKQLDANILRLCKEYKDLQ